LSIDIYLFLRLDDVLVEEAEADNSNDDEVLYNVVEDSSNEEQAPSDDDVAEEVEASNLDEMEVAADAKKDHVQDKEDDVLQVQVHDLDDLNEVLVHVH
jgi:hypothetical protein